MGPFSAPFRPPLQAPFRSPSTPGAAVAIEPFDGVFLDTANGDTFTSRFTAPSDPALTVSDSSIAFSSSSAVSLDVTVKEDDGTAMWQCFDYFKIEATFTVTSFPAADSQGFMIGWKRSDGAANYFTGEVKAHPSSATLLYRRLWLNGSIRVSGAGGYSFTPGVNGTLTYERQGDFITCTITFNNGVSTETLTKTMVYSATSDELPRLLGIPFIRFIRGISTLTSFKVSASYPTAKYAFVGDSLTQGRFATAYADGFPQLIRADHPGQVTVSGAPSATTGNWLNGTRSVIRMQPQYAFVLLGVNDINGAVADATIKSNYTTIMNRFIAAGVTPIALTVPPFNHINVPAFNTWLKAQGWAYIDIYPLLEGTTNQLNAAYNSGDGIHWNTAGNLVVANAIRDYITTNGL